MLHRTRIRLVTRLHPCIFFGILVSVVITSRVVELDNLSCAWIRAHVPAVVWGDVTYLRKGKAVMVDGVLVGQVTRLKSSFGP